LIGVVVKRTESQNTGAGERLQRVLAARGIASRRKAEELIRSGRVTVDGEVVTVLGTRVDPERVSIRVDGKPVRRQPLRYILMNKPSGFITTTSDERGRHTVMDLLPPGSRVNPVGRLDRDTEGLLLFTNDGDVANRVMHPRYGLTKEYLIQTADRPSEAAMRRVRDGIEIDGKRVVPHEFRIVRETAAGALLSMVIHEGMHRVVRRMLEAADIPVSKLTRARIGPLSVSGIPRGAHRELTPGEVISLFQSLHIDRDSSEPAPRQAVSSRGSKGARRTSQKGASGQVPGDRADG
jgi:23S rRNA pseudouridine2605 synthase